MAKLELEKHHHKVRNNQNLLAAKLSYVATIYEANIPATGGDIYVCVCVMRVGEKCCSSAGTETK